MTTWLLFMASPLWLRGLILLAYFAVALSVTAHVLLTKTNVRAAMGWIGLGWFSPFLGGLLYYVFGINRVARRAVKLERAGPGRSASGDVAPGHEMPANIARLAATGSRIAETPVLPGNAVTILSGGETALTAMLSAINEAKHSIALASYIFRNDETGSSFAEALIAAHRRGVCVRVLLDGIGAGYFFPTVLWRLRAAGVPAHLFLHSWLPWRMPFLNMRNHKKLLIIDGATGFTGGFNIGVEYSGRLKPRASVRDVQVRFEGPIVGQLMESFAEDWAFTADEELDQAIWWPALAHRGGIFARGISSGPDTEINKLEALLGAALTEARQTVRIVSPYFLPDESLQFAIAQAELRGVTVEILIPQAGDSIIVDWAMRAHLRFLAGETMAIYETPPPFDHAKLMTVDGQWCLVGSSNWDARSLRLNFEFDVECYDEGVTAGIDALIDQRIANSRRLDRKLLMTAGRGGRLRDAAARLLLPYL